MRKEIGKIRRKIRKIRRTKRTGSIRGEVHHYLQMTE
jgi:hypothetical protein